jgi:hypothetical protein
MFAFGGHLACGTNRTGCWGDTGEDVNGAANINGGPYHIKLLTLDGASAGNQDNQIMSSAIAPLADTSILTSQHGSASTTFSWDATIYDTATVTGNNPTGTVTFNLYGPADGTCSGTAIWTDTQTLDSSGSATSLSFTDIGSAGTYGAGTYHWTVSYSGDVNNAPSGPTDCGEAQVVTAATKTDASASPS